MRSRNCCTCGSAQPGAASVRLPASKRSVCVGPAPSALMRPRTGLAALALADISITGLTKAGDKMLAILTSPDRQSFVLHVNDQLLDARVKAIDQQGVVFVQQVEGGGKPLEIRKALRAAAEVIR